MHREPKDPLTQWTDRALKQLPARRAPSGFAPRVLTAIQQRAALPWYQRPWLRWPRTLQAISALGTGGLFGVAIWGVTLAQAAANPLVSEVKREAFSVLNIFSAVLQALSLGATRIPMPVWGAALGMVAVAWVSCLALGTACWRLTGGRR